MKKILSLLATFILSAGLIFASENTTQESEVQNVEKKVLKVGFITNAPYLMKGDRETGFREGYCYDYLQMISNLTGWEYEYVYGEWHDLYLKLVDGEIDLLQDVSFSADRKNLILYPDSPMGKENYHLYVKNVSSEIAPETIASDLNGKRIGVTDGSVQHRMLVKWLSDHSINAKVVPLTSDVQRDYDFENGNLDAIVSPEESSHTDWEPVLKIGYTDYYLALSKNCREELKELNRAQAILNSVMPQFTDELFYKYYSHSVVSRRISPEEKNYIYNVEKIHVGYCDDFISGTAENNPGTAKILIEKAAENLGIPADKFDYTFYRSSDEMIRALHEDKIQLAYPACAIPGSAEIDDYSLVKEVAAIPSLLFTKKDFNSSKITKVGALGNAGFFYHAKRCCPNAEVILYTSPNVMLDDLAAGKINGATMPEMIYKIILGIDRKYGKFQMEPTREQFPTAIVCHRGNTLLFSLLVRGFSLMDSDFISTVVAANNVHNGDYSFKTFIEHNNFLVFLFLVLISGLTCSFIIAENRKRILRQKYEMEKELRQDLTEALHITEEHQKKEKELLALSETDFLTGVLNRGGEGKIRQLMDIGTKGMLCVLDIDKFKDVNDKYGHAAGDKALVAIATVMKNVFRDTDVILRLGGDQFGVFAIGISDVETATNLLERLVENFEKIEIRDLNGEQVTVSIGAAFIPSKTSGDRYEEFFRKADDSRCRSKNQYGNSFTII